MGESEFVSPTVEDMELADQARRAEGLICRSCRTAGFHWARTRKGTYWLQDERGRWHICKQRTCPPEP